ncbi:hypothetical protein [Candidatus Poriferisocius sp.]|uniref:hypothetical protein n=1 Tax=Candidatus Poriferisocius sp. TaxID=3101276 RepID=UPI003B02BAFB
MTKTKLIFIGLALALVGFLFAGSASAQDGPSITADPSSVEAAGEQTFTVTGSGWTGSPIAVLPCDMPASGSLDDVDASTCNQGNMQVVGALDANGGFTAEITIDVPENGIVIGSGDFAQTESARAAITVGMMEDELATTGVNTSLLVIIGTGIALAGVMVFGLSRRMRTL